MLLHLNESYAKNVGITALEGLKGNSFCTCYLIWMLAPCPLIENVTVCVCVRIFFFFGSSFLFSGLLL